MNKKQQVSLNQVGILLPAAAYGGIAYLFSEIISRSGRAAWVAVLASSIPIVALAIWILLLTKSYPGQTVFDILRATTGKLVGGAFGFLYILIMIVVSALFLMQFCAMIKTYFLLVSPIFFPMVLTILTSYIIASKGVEPLARTALVVVVFLVLIAFTALGIGIFHLFDWSNIFPIFDRDIFAFMDGWHIATGLLSETLLLQMIMAAFYPRSLRSGKQIILIILGGSVIIPAAFLFLLVGLSSPEEMSRNIFVGITVAQAISFGRFLQGLEAFVLIAYEILVVIKLSLNIYAGQMVCSQIFGGKYGKIIMGAIALTVLFLSLMVGSINAANYYYIRMAKYIIPPFVLTVLTLTTLAVWIKGKRSRRAPARNKR